LDKLGKRDKILKFDIADESLKLLKEHEYKGIIENSKYLDVCSSISDKKEGTDIILPEDLKILNRTRRIRATYSRRRKY